MDKRHNPPRFACPQCGQMMPKGAIATHVRGMHDDAYLAWRFWAKVDKSPHPLGCWIWKACRSTVTKYGTFSYKGSNINAHRAAWLLTNGPIEEPGIDVLHTCDNGIGGCVRPDHLYLGTDADNTRDKMKAGRHMFGERNSHAKLTEEIVRQLRLANPKGREIDETAARLGVKPSTVHHALSGRTWKHL